MSKYPDDPPPKAPFSFRSNRPLVSGGPEWAPQDRALTRFGLGEADLFYEGNPWSEIKTLYDFYESVGGASGRFTFVDFNAPDSGGQAWADLFVAKGDGAEDTWDLPTYALVASPAPVIKESGTTKTSAVTPAGSPDVTKDYNIVLGTGTDGVDLLIATAAPASPIIVTISGTCRRAFRRAKFTNAKNPFVYDVPDFFSAGPVTIIEVRK